MNKIINGKRYDTDTAKELAWDASNEGRNDFHFWKETLYQKRTGEFFLYGEGGAMSRYAERIDQNSWSGGSQIIPLTVEAAKKWAEEHLDGDEYEELFELTEDESKRTVTFSLPENAIESLTRMAAEAGINKSEMLTRLILSK